MPYLNSTIIARKSLYLGVSLVDKLQGNHLRGPIVLCYHSFGDDNWLHGVSVEAFEYQIKLLTSKYKQTTAGQIDKILKGEKIDLSDRFLITIDDGYQDVLKIKDIVKKYQIKPILFLLSDKRNLNRKEMDNKKKLLTDSQIKVLINDGWEIGSHGATHSDFYSLSQLQIEKEVVESKKTLESAFKKRVKYFAYPKGRYNKNALDQVIKAKYKMAFSMDDGFITKKTNRYIIPRIGVNRTHSMTEFEQMMSPLVVRIRGYIKSRIKGLVI